MLQSFMLRVLCLLFTSRLTICMAGSGAASPIVTGTLGQSVSLSPGIPVGTDVADFQWKQTKSQMAVVLYSKGNITYLGSEDFKSRLTLDPVSFSLEIRDLRREDAGDYEVISTAGSGIEKRVTVRLEVYESSGLTMNNIIIISSVTGIFVVFLIFCFIKKIVKRGQMPGISGEPPPVETEYAVVQPVQNRVAGRGPRQGNEMVHRQDERLEIPNTVYATVNAPRSPAAEPDRVKRGARRNVRDSSFDMYETQHYPGNPRLATIRTGAGARGKFRPI
ncbi:uncharacterized protein LOC134343515 isoform X2 [Mobula hypostoma]|uniref:uncharacterized protein LOC134343515 isoform X2 n=1 Tax=Mobula hypostoma TaxID=723540 RepID=UPI002FC2B6EF